MELNREDEVQENRLLESELEAAFDQALAPLPEVPLLQPEEVLDAREIRAICDPQPAASAAPAASATPAAPAASRSPAAPKTPAPPPEPPPPEAPTMSSLLADIPDIPPEGPPAPTLLTASAQPQPRATRRAGLHRRLPPSGGEPFDAEPEEPRRRGTWRVAVASLLVASTIGLALGAAVMRLLDAPWGPRRTAAPAPALAAGRAAPPAERKAPEPTPGPAPATEKKAAAAPAAPATGNAGQQAAKRDDDELERAFGPPPSERKSASREAKKPPERSVYIPPAPAEAPGEKARLTPSDIREVVVRNKKDILACVNAARAKDPDLSGTLRMRWTVTPAGDVENVQILSEDLLETELAQCVSEAISGWLFPEHTQAQPPITFPFKF